MKGSVILNFDKNQEKIKGGDYFALSVNNVRTIDAYQSVNGLYEYPVEVGQQISLAIASTNSGDFESIDLYRKDFTTDDEGGDMGIKETFITGITAFNATITLTAATRPDAYNFHYIVSAATIPCFEEGTGFSGFTVGGTEITDIDLLSDGKMICSGEFLQYSGVSANRIIKLSTDGTIDTSFVYGTGFTGDTANTVVERSDGTLVVVGQFTNYNGTAANRIISLNANGSVNTGFTYGTGFNQDAIQTLVLSNDKVLVSGQFYEYNGTTSSKLVRINTDGSIDGTFSVGTGFTSGGTYTSFNVEVTDIALQSDGKIIAVGDFDAYKGTAAPRIARITTGATIDTSFSGATTGFNGDPATVAIQSDGKILVGGFFTSYNGSTYNRIIRLNSDGSVDTSFSGNTSGFNAEVNKIVVQSDGKILVGGNFTQYNGSNTRLRIMRLNSDGSVDTTFGVNNAGANTSVKEIVVLPNSTIIIGGTFTQYRGVNASRIAKMDKFGSELMC